MHNVSLRCQRRTEPRSYVTRAKIVVQIGRVVPKISSQTNKHTDSVTGTERETDRHAHHNTPLPYRGGVNTNTIRVAVDA